MALDLSKCYRAKVIDDNYKNGGAGVAPGSVKVSVEDWNADSGKPAEIWAYPLNGFFLGSDSGKKKNQNIGQCLIPPKGSDVWVAWEDPVKDTNNGGIAWYFGSCGFNNKQTIPKENSSRSEPQKTYTLIRSPKGRGIIVSDDSDESSIIIKGKNAASGNLVNDSDMSITLEENTLNEIVIKSGNGKQFIIMNKDLNLIDIIQGDSEILMHNDQIKISSNHIALLADRIDLN